jgi:hypothetical protein
VIVQDHQQDGDRDDRDQEPLREIAEGQVGAS